MKKPIVINHLTPEELVLPNLIIHKQNGHSQNVETLEDYVQTLDLNDVFNLFFGLDAVNIQTPEELQNFEKLLEENFKQHNYGDEDFFEAELSRTVEEDAICSDFNTDIIKEALRLDLFPMAINLEYIDFLTIRFHKKKSIITWDNFRIPHKVPEMANKHFKGYTMTFNKDFDGTLKNLLEAYPNTWLTPRLLEAFTEIHNNPTENISIDSVEIWDREGNLVAGELGFITGSVYTSLTGYHKENHIGNVQLSALGIYLKENNFTYWDLGMYIEYKMRYGAKLYTRDEQNQIYKSINPNRIKLTDKTLTLTDFFNI